MPVPRPPSPEHDKLDEKLELREFSQRLGEALDSNGVVDHRGFKYVLMTQSPYVDHRCITCGSAVQPVASLQRALADLLGIDYMAFQEEKEAMLAYIRDLNRQDRVKERNRKRNRVKGGEDGTGDSAESVGEDDQVEADEG